MSLFKRLLLSLFPENFWGSLGPASMFLGLVNAKHFFTVITKRMVENPKFNLFDIGGDPVEVKIGFGSEPNIKPKDLELYFSYCVCANLNGYKLYNPTNIAALMSISLSQYFVKDFERSKKGNDQFMVLLICINIVSYVFASRVKVFPAHLDPKDSFNWFVTVFFNYYQFLLGVYNIKIGKKAFQELQKKLSAHTDIFFWLYYIYKKLNTYLDDSQVSSRDFMDWMFMDELKKGKNKADFAKLHANIDEYIFSTKLSPMEDKVLDALMPAEILIKLLYNREDVFWISEYVIPTVYPTHKMDAFIHSFLQSDDELENWIEFILDHKLWKANFFPSLKKMITHKFHKNDPENEANVESFLSSISDGLGMNTLPEGFKKEGMLMDRVLNFYVGLMGSLWSGRGDNMYMRLFRRPLITSSVLDIHTLQRHSVNYYTEKLYQYSKLAFFYRTIFDGVRSGKASFVLPFVADIKEIYNNLIVLKLLTENALAILFQDILSKDIKLSIQQDSLIEIFQKLHGKKIWQWVKLKNDALIEAIYTPFIDLIEDKSMMEKIKNNLTVSDIRNIKENLYSFDFQVMQECMKKLKELELPGQYVDTVIYTLLASLRDTLVGILFMIHMCLEKQQQKKIDLQIYRLVTLYCKEVLCLTEEESDLMSKIIFDLYEQYKNLIGLWAKIDDNQYFLEVGTDCRWIFISKESTSQHIINTEDVMRFWGYLKHITYYNKRFIIPKM